MEIKSHNPEMFTLFSLINNKNMWVSEIAGSKSGIRCKKADNCIIFKNITLNQEIHIQNEHVKEFAMLVLESYVMFVKEFEGMEVRIDIRVEENKK